MLQCCSDLYKIIPNFINKAVVKAAVA